MKNLPVDKVYDILMDICGASIWDRDSFIYHHTHSDGFSEYPKEWRFQGHLGFGGKFWRKSDRIYVNCYNEDLTPERQEIIDLANYELEKLVKNMGA